MTHDKTQVADRSRPFHPYFPSALRGSGNNSSSLAQPLACSSRRSVEGSAAVTSDQPRYPEPTDATGQPLRNTALVEAMRNVSVHDSPESRALLFRLLLETQLVAVTPEQPERSGTRIAGAGETLNLVTLADAEGTVLPLFSSVAALLRWRPEGAGYVALPSRAVFEMAAQNGTNRIVLDLDSPTSGYVTRYEIEQLARGRLPLGEAGDVVAESTEVKVGRPAVPPPPQALDALRSELQAQPLAERAWYFLMQQGGQEPEMCVAIRFAPDLADEGLQQAMRTIIDGAGERTEGVKDLSFLVADDGWQSSLSGGSGEEFFSRTPAPRRLPFRRTGR